MPIFNKTKSFLFFCTTLIAFSLHSVAFSSEQTDLELLYKKGEFAQVVDNVKTLSSEELTPDIYSMYIYSLASNDLDDAEEAADKAIRQYKDDPDLFLIHADIMGRQAQDSVFSALSYAEKALNSLKKAAELAPNKAKYRQGLMTFYLAAPSIAGGDTELALEQAKEITKLDKVKGTIAFANYYNAVDKVEEAINSLQEGVNAHPNNIELPYQLANIYVSNERFDDGINAFKLVVSRLPSAPEDNDFTKDELSDYLDSQNTMILNSHYQIARVALVGETQQQTGIQHLDHYISLYKEADFDVQSLPSVDWANLRKAGLLFSIKQTAQAKEAIALVNVEDDKNMKKIHKKLLKKINKALK